MSSDKKGSLCWVRERAEIKKMKSAQHEPKLIVSESGLILLMEHFDKYVSVTLASFTGFPLCTIQLFVLLLLAYTLSSFILSGGSTVR